MDVMLDVVVELSFAPAFWDSLSLMYSLMVWGAVELDGDVLVDLDVDADGDADGDADVDADGDAE